MSVNNIYDTFLSIKITPDTKSRLEEIRDITEQIIQNRNKINNMGNMSVPPPPPSGGGDGPPGGIGSSSPPPRPFGPPPPPGMSGATSSTRRSKDPIPSGMGPHAEVHSIVMQSKKLKDLFIEVKRDSINPELSNPGSESYRNLKWGTVGKTGGFKGMFQKGMNKLFDNLKLKIRDSVYNKETDTPEFKQAVKDIRVLTAAHNLTVAEIKPIVTRLYGNAKLFRRVLRETGDIVSRASKLEFNMIDSFGALSTQSLSQVSLTDIPGATTTEEDEALEKYKYAIKTGNTFDFSPEQSDQIKILNYKFGQSARDPRTHQKSQKNFMQYLKTIMGSAQFTPDAPMPMALNPELMNELGGQGLADDQMANLIKRNTESTGRRITAIVNKGQADKWLDMIPDDDPEMKEYLGNVIDENMSRNKPIVLTRNIGGEYEMGKSQRQDIGETGFVTTRDVLTKVNRAYVLTKEFMDINMNQDQEANLIIKDTNDSVQDIQQAVGKVAKWVARQPEVPIPKDHTPDNIVIKGIKGSREL